MSSDEFPAPADPEGLDAPLDGDASAAASTADNGAGEAAEAAEPADGKKAKRAKKEKAPKEPKPPKEPKAKKEKTPKEPKPAKEPKAEKEKTPKEPKAAKAPKEPKAKKPKRAKKGEAPADEAALDDGEVGWSTDGEAAWSADDAFTGPDGIDADASDEAATDEAAADGAPPASRRRLVGAAAVGPLLLVAALFLPTDRGRHGAAAVAAPVTTPADDVGAGEDEAPVDTAPEDTTPRFLVTVEQDLPTTTTFAEPTTTTVGAAGHGEAAGGHTSTAAAAGHDEEGAETTARRSSTRTSAPPPFTVTQYDREDTQLAVFVLLDGRRIELAVPVRYFHLVSVSDPAQTTFDKEVAGHLLVLDRDGRYWGADLQSVPALLYQLPSAKPLEAPTTTAAADGHGGAHGTTTTTIHEGGHPATGTTAHQSTVHEDPEVTTPASVEPEVEVAVPATHAEGHESTEADDEADGTADDEATGTERGTTTTEDVREPFPLVVRGPVSDEDERVVRLLAALPGVTSVLDLGRGAVMVEGDVALEDILNVPGVLGAQPSSS